MAEKNLTASKNQGLVLAIALLALLVPVIAIEAQVMGFTKGYFIYPVDDAFIHMQVARNLAEHGNWGINPHEFGSASSSLLYTVLLALLFKIFSVSHIIPFLINIAAAIFLIVVMSRWMQKQNLKPAAQIFILLLVIFLTPLPILVISGMEHTLQCLFSFLFLFSTADWIERNRNVDKEKWRLPISLPVYGMLVTAIRYEGLFLVAGVCLVLVYFRKISLAFQLGLISVLPVLAFGIYSVSKGSYFLPNSVLIKSEEVPLFGAGVAHFLQTIFVEKLTLAKAGITAMATQRLLLILPIAALLLWLKPLQQRVSFGILLFVLTLTTFLHLALASTGKFYRYEAYLILCSVLLTGTIAANYSKFYVGRKWNAAWFFGAVLILFLFLPLLLRSSAAFSKASRACINIYEQQYQMGQFLKTYDPSAVVAANDIGAVAFYTRDTIVDLWGLGSIEIARSRKNHQWNPAFLDSVCRKKNARLAIIYDSWFNHGFDNRWHKLATWQIPDNVVCGDDVVSFYAIDSTIISTMKKNLIEYQQHLPSEVTVKYY
ncbi:MAG: hypothetical protein ACJ75B_20660 [Flavisolibacter sp.]